MPEWEMLPIPLKLVKQGVRDMVRISDARMSGTSYGACILHVAPESYVGGPLALVQTGDLISIDIPARSSLSWAGQLNSTGEGPRGWLPTSLRTWIRVDVCPPCWPGRPWL
ncbi:dihydroxy-acid dehydratase [Bradyrhizobium manausense]|nr:dihydroxy-acid dehydratase [Bradyrhizobium manausense]